MIPTKPPRKETQPFLTQNSAVLPLANDKVIANFTVWSHLAPSVKKDPDSVFGKLLVLPGSTERRFRVKQIFPEGYDHEEFELDASNCFNTNDDMPDSTSFRDVGQLGHQNSAAVLHFLEQHWRRGNIYTVVDPLLVAINPFCDLGNSSDEIALEYKHARVVDDLPPHVFALARRALDNFVSLRQSQTIIVTGESGAGKTEATKMIMRFFAAGSQEKGVNQVQESVLAANPVLEAFGNAKTVRNDNSSRFGRFMQFDIGSQGIRSGQVQVFLLEKVRVVSQEPEERSFHIFYQLLKGATKQERQTLGLLPSSRDYANLQGSEDAGAIDDAADWLEVRRAFKHIGLDNEAQVDVLRILSAVLHFGNVKIVPEADDGSKVENPDVAELASQLAGLPGSLVMAELTSTRVQVGGMSVEKRLRAEDAVVQRASLCKALYERLFHWLVKKLNAKIAPSNGRLDCFIGMLDIFGFEIFANNSLEQLLINITNEMLQNNFVEIVFAREQELYQQEGISTAELVYTSNSATIETLVGKTSLFSQLEDACLAPGGSDASFVLNCCRVLADNPGFKPTKTHATSKFIIAHSVADVEYNADGFLRKNKDLLKAELSVAIQNASNPLTRQLMDGVAIQRGKLAKGQLIASQFMNSLTSLMELIRSTEPHFIRCIKPNETKSPKEWNGAKVLNQLFCLSILEALQLKQLGFSYRRPFADFCRQVRYLDVAAVDDESLERSAVADKILRENGMRNMKDYQIGKTRVFMTSETFKALMLEQRKALGKWKSSVQIIEAAMLLYKYRIELGRELWRLQRLQAFARVLETPLRPPPAISREDALRLEAALCKKGFEKAAFP